MSQQAREEVTSSPNLFYQNASQKSDLLDIALTDSNLIALLDFLLDRGHYIELTAVRTDHHNDGPSGHAGGLAFDSWPLGSARAGDYLDAADSEFVAYLKDIAEFPGLYQLGLAGTAYTQANVKATGLQEDFSADPCIFHDDGADHVHVGIHKA